MYEQYLAADDDLEVERFEHVGEALGRAVVRESHAVDVALAAPPHTTDKGRTKTWVSSTNRQIGVCKLSA